MLFQAVGLIGAYVIEPEEHSDDRGFFARTWCLHETEKHGLETGMVQSSISYNRKKGTLRGMHYSAPPAKEAKWVRCTKGSIFDVIIDLRSESETFLQHVAVELTEANHRALYIPPGIAHGFQTLTGNTEVLYMMSDFYRPETARGVRWNDPAFEIQWPRGGRTIIERDNSYPDFDPEITEELKVFSV